MPLDGFSATVAYQRVRLEEVRDLYQELDLDLDQYLNVELRVSKRLDYAEKESIKVRDRFLALGVDLDNINPSEGFTDLAPPQVPLSKKCRKIEIGNPDDFRDLTEEAETYLSKAGVDLSKDPLLQVIGSTETTDTLAAYRERYGDIHWETSDYLAVIFAGFIATPDRHLSGQDTVRHEFSRKGTTRISSYKMAQGQLGVRTRTFPRTFRKKRESAL